MFYSKFDTPLCSMIIFGDDAGIQQLHLCNVEGSRRELSIDNNWQRNDAMFADVKKQIEEYLAGERQVFDIKLNMQGTAFQRSVWQQLQKIPYGESCSYQQIAHQLGNDKACRAVGSANGRNPVPIIVPCHRVIGSSGQLTGYAFGLAVKQRLLTLEAQNLSG